MLFKIMKVYKYKYSYPNIDYDKILSLNTHKYYEIRKDKKIPDKPTVIEGKHVSGGGRISTKKLKYLIENIKPGDYIDFPTLNKSNSFRKYLQRKGMTGCQRTIKINKIYRFWRVN